MSKQFTLGKNERLKSRKLIEQLFSEGKNFAVNPFRIYYSFLPLTIPYADTFGRHPDIYRRDSLLTIQFGVGVGTKNFKRAVDRNRIKRITREAYRLQKLPLQEKLKEKKISLNVFFIYTAKELTSCKEASDKMNLILIKLIKMVDEVK
jgi:ribonuclease P protein component